MITQRLKGTGVALVTPFDANLNIDFTHLSGLIQFINQQGTHYWVIHGTTGEAATTSKAEKKEILDFLVANNPRRLPIVYGLGGNNTQEILNTLLEMDFRGIDAILSVTPYYNRPSQQGLYAHYQAIANASPVPVILYNVPSRTGIHLAAHTVIALSKHPNIIGIKEASGNLEQCLDIATHTPADFLLISGDDILTVPMMAIGAVGVISTLANAFPKHFYEMVEAVFRNDYIKAQKYQADLLAINRLVIQEGNPVAIKQILEARQLCMHYVRLPLASCSDNIKQEINKMVRSLSFS
jgi:4-hydroxy-tetrahydrodipicolinate synthase